MTEQPAIPWPHTVVVQLMNRVAVEPVAVYTFCRNTNPEAGPGAWRSSGSEGLGATYDWDEILVVARDHGLEVLQLGAIADNQPTTFTYEAAVGLFQRWCTEFDAIAITQTLSAQYPGGMIFEPWVDPVPEALEYLRKFQHIRAGLPPEYMNALVTVMDALKEARK